MTLYEAMMDFYKAKIDNKNLMIKELQAELKEVIDCKMKLESLNRELKIETIK